MDLHGRSLLKEIDFTAKDFGYLIDLGGRLRMEKHMGQRASRLAGRNIALVFEKTSARTRSAFEVAAHDEGGSVTYLGPEEFRPVAESMKDTARVLGRMFDGIAYCGSAQEDVEILARYAGVPVWNGLTDQWHPTQMLADMLTMRDHAGKPQSEISYCYLGDGQTSTANSLLVTGALLGMDVRICAPDRLQPSPTVWDIAAGLTSASSAQIMVTDDILTAVARVDFVYTDIWLPVGEPAEKWDERISLLLPYQVDQALLKATGNPDVKFMHCLPALRGRETDIGQRLHDRRGLDALEVTEDVFESPASIVFDQAENRLHTIKAVMVATAAEQR